MITQFQKLEKKLDFRFDFRKKFPIRVLSESAVYGLNVFCIVFALTICHEESFYL